MGYITDQDLTRRVAYLESIVKRLLRDTSRGFTEEEPFFTFNPVCREFICGPHGYKLDVTFFESFNPYA